MPSQPLTPETTLGAQSPGSQPEEAAPAQFSHAGHPSGLAIIGSKISPAVEDRRVLTRARLVGWLDQQRHARVCLLTAEAGYGKSTLLSDFARRSDQTCVWYRLETSDGDWITFLSYMVAALRDVLPGFGRSTEALLRNVAAMGPSRELVLAQFLADLSAADGIEMIVILDDYHLVSDSADIRMIVSRLIERAPTGMHFVLAGRRRPSLALGRLAAQGQVVELSTSDLRFTRPEIEEFFALSYGQPLDQHACDVVAERTQGWAASLQLVAASLAVSRPSEVGAFIEALSGATGPIYDFLAEEVLTRMSPVTHRVLLHASLVDRVSPSLVAAAMSVSDEPVSVDTVAVHLEDARTLGLLGSAEVGSGGARIHPLFRDFLQHQFAESTPPDRVRRMHLVIAQAAEDDAWLVAAKHFALAGAEPDAMRVIGSAASEALGTGAWGAAVEVVALMPDATPPPAVDVIKARALLASGKVNAAMQILGAVNNPGLTPEERGLVNLTNATASHLSGDGAQVESHVLAVASDLDIPSPLRDVAITWRQMLEANHGGRITDAIELLTDLSTRQLRAGLTYFAGVTLHNTANAELARGRYQAARRLAQEAIAQLTQSDDSTGILASSRAIAAIADCELGQLPEGLRVALATAAEPGATADAIAEAAYVSSVTGRRQQAESLLARLERGDAPWSNEMASRAQASHARFCLCVSVGDLTGARLASHALRTLREADVDAPSRSILVDATLAYLEGSSTAPSLAQEAVDTCANQHAWRWSWRARLLTAAATRDCNQVALWIREADRESALTLLEMADVIASVIGLVSPLPEAIERSIIQAPARWLPALSRQVLSMKAESASAAASLVARFGTLEDASVLRAFDQQSGRKPRRKGFMSKLIRRVSPTVRVHDLGPTNYDVGNRVITLTETRRRAAMLMLYLITRPRLTATRDQVLECLWPDQPPRSALNSLHQTLFYLRRDIEPWYEENSTADYVRMEQDLVFLDEEMFQVDSVAFSRQAAAILKSGAAASRGPELLSLYRGRFAPEFEYEEWAESWRTALHGSYLHLAHRTATDLVHAGRMWEATEVLTPIASIDPHAFELRATLIGCLAAIGSADAAAAHYQSYADLHIRDLGVPAPSYDHLVMGVNSSRPSKH